MKKLLLAAAATTAIYGGATFADTEDMFYLKANVGGDILTEQTNNDTKLKVKSDNNYFFGVGVGYYLMDNVRADLTFDHYVDPELKKTGNVANITGNVTSKHKADINSLMLNAYVDLVDVSITKIFVGAGVGLAQIKEKISRTGGTPNNDYSVNAKKEDNFSYALHAGVSTEFAPGVNGELSYSWRDFGKTKSANTLAKAGFPSVDVGKTDYRGHHLVFGVRFDI